MKKILVVMAASAMLLAACNEKPVEIPVLDVTMSSFKFEAEKNACLKTDYVVENPSKDISFVLPYGTDEEAVKSLIPTFTVTEGSTVSVADKEIISGVTALDFSYPVEFLVTLNEKSNAQYTVRVELAGPQAFAFAAKAEVADSISKGPYLAISPKDNSPYFAVITDNEKTDLRYPVLCKYNGSSISKVATVAEIRADQPTLAFTPDGTAIYAFYNNKAKKLCVYSLGSTPTPIATEETGLYQPLTNSNYSTIGIAAVSGTNIYAGYGVNAKSGSLVKRALNLCHYNGSAWEQEIPIPGRKSTNYAYEVISKRANGADYMLVFNQNEHSVSVYKFNDNGVTTIFEGISVSKPLATEEEIAAGNDGAKINLYGLGLDVDSMGNPYVLMLPEASSTVKSGYSPVVYKFTPEDGLHIVGGILSTVDGQAAKYLSIALDSNDIPYLAYKDPESGKATYTYIDAKTKVWATPTTLSTDEVSSVSIAFAEDGTGYISCAEKLDGGKNDYITLYKTL